MKKFFKYFSIIILVAGLGFILGFFVLKNINKKLPVILTPTIISIATPSDSNFSLENAPSESLRGQITKMIGNIDWQGRTATESARIVSPISIQQGENLITEENATLSLNFPNICTVNFSPKTEIDVIQTLPAGLVFTQITGVGEYIKTGDDSVSVRSLNLLTEVDGDSLISINPKKPIITLSIKSGSIVAAYNDLKYNSHEVTVTAGHTYTFNSSTRRGVAK